MRGDMKGAGCGSDVGWDCMGDFRKEVRFG